MTKESLPLRVVFTGHVDHRKSTIIGRGLFCCGPLLFSVTLAVSLVALMSGCSVEARKARYLASAEKYFNAGDYEKAKIEYMKLLCNYIYDTYGRFPAHVDAFHVPGVWMQFSHLELEYYDKYFDPALYSRQAAHVTWWGDHAKDLTDPGGTV